MELLQIIPQFLISGLTLGAIYGLVALGFVTIARASQIINFAQGQFVMLGGMVTFFFIKSVHLPYLISAFLAIGVVICLGFVLLLLVIYPLRKASLTILILATLGACLIVSSSSALLF